MPFHYENDAEMIVKTAALAEAFTPEMYAHLLTLLPTPEGFAELHNRFEAGYPIALKGNPEKVKAFEADRNAVNIDVSLLFGLAKIVAIKDPTVPETLGLGRLTEKAAAAAPPPLAAPRDFKVVFDPKGHLFASVTKVAGAKGYQIWACEGDPSIEANWKLIESASNCKGILISGLNRGKYTLLRIRAMRGREAGPWSNYVTIDPT